MKSENIYPIIYTINKRKKSRERLEIKIKKKYKEGRFNLKKDNLLQITDFMGIRVLHVFQDQARKIHEVLMKGISEKEFCLHEKPIVYSWDPDAIRFFRSMKLKTEVKDSYYTSVHYVLRPKKKSNITCEVQVRTLYEEIWGEIDHALKYSNPRVAEETKKQLKVLAKLTAACGSLASSLYEKIPKK